MAEETVETTTEKTETVETPQHNAGLIDAWRQKAEALEKRLNEHKEKGDLNRKRESELLAKIKEYEDKELAAETDLKKKAEALEKRVKDVEHEYGEKLSAADKRYVRAEVRAAAIKAGIIDADDVDSMDLSDLRIDEDGNVTGVDTLMAAHKERKPHWFKAEKSTDEKPEKKVVVTPARKSGDSSLDFATVPDADFRKKLDSYGVKL
jgi:chromosome segregation ATPase